MPPHSKWQAWESLASLFKLGEAEDIFTLTCRVTRPSPFPTLLYLQDVASLGCSGQLCDRMSGSRRQAKWRTHNFSRTSNKSMSFPFFYHVWVHITRKPKDFQVLHRKVNDLEDCLARLCDRVAAPWSTRLKFDRFYKQFEPDCGWQRVERVSQRWKQTRVLYDCRYKPAAVHLTSGVCQLFHFSVHALYICCCECCGIVVSLVCLNNIVWKWISPCWVPVNIISQLHWLFQEGKKMK